MSLWPYSLLFLSLSINGICFYGQFFDETICITPASTRPLFTFLKKRIIHLFEHFFITDGMYFKCYECALEK